MPLQFTANVTLARRVDTLKTISRLDCADFVAHRSFRPATLVVRGEFKDVDTFRSTLAEYLPSDAEIVITDRDGVQV